ncbi:hypothetical protein MZTS_16010 [Methylorubrum zatmanii]|jgi:hypothetical protein|uniref:Uncharacterized protein n=1 Tax=Methylobacterium nonmethylotrophicum TaxID=1141884 RepID=A0A4Z0NF74_9HYPH|nr:hypothetical protein [Methylorubrum zatmanii]TGD92917.1 hypothetical protein EU555_34030 [Methylobacterium nonmethylotrophicum]
MTDAPRFGAALTAGLFALAVGIGFVSLSDPAAAQGHGYGQSRGHGGSYSRHGGFGRPGYSGGHGRSYGRHGGSGRGFGYGGGHRRSSGGHGGYGGQGH